MKTKIISNGVGKKLLFLAILVMMFSISGCGKNTNTNTNTAATTNTGANTGVAPGYENLPPLPENTIRVRINSQQFIAKTAIVKVGMTVMWLNQDTVDHQIQSATFSSPVLKPGDTFSYTFNNVGTFDYNCALHPTLTGKIIVQANQ